MSALKNLQCKNCGAQLTFDPSDVTMRCDFCDSEFVVEVPESEEERKLREEGSVILFKVERDQARTTFARWIKKGLFKPNDLAQAFREKEFSGVYIPFFKITADAHTDWDGRDKVVIREASEDEPAEYEYHPRSGHHEKSYKDFITASKGLEQGEVDRIMPYDDNDAKPFDAQLLMGFRAEKPGISMENATTTCKERIQDWEKDECRKKVDELRSTNTSITNLMGKLFMLPIWILVYLYKDKPYRVLINGQSGKIRGKKPVSAVKVIIAILILIALGVGGFFLWRMSQGQ